MSQGYNSATLPHLTEATHPLATVASAARRNIIAASRGALLLALAYYTGARIGFALQSPVVPQSILWLPNSILLSALLLAPKRYWPVYFVAVFPAQLAAAAHVHAPLLPLSLLYLTNWADAALGASLVHYFARGPVLLSRLRNMLLVLVLACTLSTALVSFADAAVALWTGWTDAYWLAWATRTRANLLTNVVLVPAVLGLYEVLRVRRSSIVAREITLSLLLVLATAVLTYICLRFASGPSALGLLYAPLAALLVGAVYFGVGVVGTQLLVMALAMSWGLLQLPHAVSEDVFAVQLILFTTAVPLLCLASVVSERARTAVALRASERRVRRQFARLVTIYRATPVGLAFVDPHMRVVSANNRIVSIAEGSLPESADRDIRTCLPGIAQQLLPLLIRVFSTGEEIHDREVTVLQPRHGDRARTCRVSCGPVHDARGKFVGANIVIQDVTERIRVEHELRESTRQLHESNLRRLDLAGRMISAQEAERRRIARELHDDFSQRLADISLELGALKEQINDRREIVRGRINRARILSRELAVGMRDLSHSLHPAALKHAGLLAALKSGCARFAEQQDIDVVCEADSVGEISDDVALCLYRIAQEALSNIARHAQARHVEVKLTRNVALVELSVVDDGIGFNPELAFKHVGLFSADERARLVDGRVIVESWIGKGTTLRAIVPAMAHSKSD
jgi:PAS domain S-box-containing protein